MNEQWHGPCQLCDEQGPLAVVRGLWVCEEHAKWLEATRKVQLLVGGGTLDMADLERRAQAAGRRSS